MIVQKQKDAAKVLGVTPNGLRKWEGEADFPPFDNGYDIDAIKAWVNERDKKGSKDAREVRTIRKHTLVQKLRREKLRADREEQQHLIEQGKLVNSEEWELYLEALISLTRDYFLAMPKELAKALPQKQQAKFIVDAEKKVTKILDYFSTQAVRGPGGE